MGTGSDSESETVVVLTDSQCYFVTEWFNHFLDHAADQICCVALAFIMICGKITHCPWFFIANLVFNLPVTVCHFKQVFSDCAG